MAGMQPQGGMVMKSLRVVDMRYALRDDQQAKLGGRMVPSPYECDCPTCTCEKEEVFEPNTFYVGDHWLSKMKETLIYPEIALLIQKAFDDGHKL